VANWRSGDLRGHGRASGDRATARSYDRKIARSHDRKIARSHDRKIT
jgi:hypothetical protein